MESLPHLREALYAINREISQWEDIKEEYEQTDRMSLMHGALEVIGKLTEVRDSIFHLGRDLYGWRD